MRSVNRIQTASCVCENTKLNSLEGWMEFSSKCESFHSFFRELIGQLGKINQQLGRKETSAPLGFGIHEGLLGKDKPSAHLIHPVHCTWLNQGWRFNFMQCSTKETPNQHQVWWFRVDGWTFGFKDDPSHCLISDERIVEPPCIRLGKEMVKKRRLKMHLRGNDSKTDSK